MSLVWRFVKAVVSLAAVAVAVLLLVLFAHARSDPWLIGTASVFLFLSALPWVDLTAPGRPLGMVVVTFSLGLFFVASRPFTHAASYPLPCTGRHAWWCQIENLLFSVGRAPLVALPFGLAAVGVLALGVRIVWRYRRSASSAAKPKSATGCAP